ncbi:carboxymuconolactone decarboxylase family protein [Ideonella sp. BN130291]|uniref:carboxymuconolactone decarboxylase family protein n=1 Tax=Ideonella sp. BN130291 TaxID=3112940 RepID=UPI002E265D86|nr:carboxymuconolactone decarboxylase family protein [Ideonella sp. BN130291]
MPRIEPVTAPYSAALQQRFARLVPPDTVPPAIFRAVARNEGLFLHLVDSGLLGPTGLLDRRVLPKPLRELLILRTCVAAGNDYEWHLHVDTISARMGLSAEQIEDTRSEVPSSGLWSAEQLAAMRLADALVRRLAVDDSLYAELRGHFDEPTLIEMTQLVGLYTGVAMLVALARPGRDAYRANKRE